ncbi:imelysin family protein [Sulfurimonas marina]|uniref:Imelysin n=1 Tax=Sulfurimonas marina TaxID=2590551 RepID=A0A7M1B0K9_9BACT|nr:imelysin family protein [Sulfurimonas marina]QOP42182.1 imelysin [Sulfurimonas marina]
MKLEKKIVGSLALVSALSFVGCGGGGSDSSDTGASAISAAEKKEVLTTYADIALANYTDALNDAIALQSAIDTFKASPTEENLATAKTAWLSARESYGTTEIFRLSNGPVDAEEGWVLTLYGAPEGQMNAWPLDENMIDYTTDADGNETSGNIIDTAGVFTPSGSEASSVDVTNITKEALAALNENGGDANVATGYHAIEFLLWGQDQDYNSFVDDTITNGALAAGERPLTDFTSAANADRRLDYLDAASDLLVEDLNNTLAAWVSSETNCTTGVGCYRGALLGELSGDDAAKNIAADDALRDIFAGMGVFIKSELANERMAVAVYTPSEEDEHSCFSDNTHRDIATNYQGFVNVLKGVYKGSSQGTSFYSKLSAEDKSSIDQLIASIDTRVGTIDSVAKSAYHFDYQIKNGNSNQDNVKYAHYDMRDLGDKMVDVAGRFGITLSEDDVTDSEETDVTK